MSDFNQVKPPEIPAISDLPDRLTDYLRRFAAYSYKGFSDRPPIQRSAVAQVYLLSPDKSVFKISVDNAGTLSAVAVAPGGGS